MNSERPTDADYAISYHHMTMISDADGDAAPSSPMATTS